MLAGGTKNGYVYTYQAGGPDNDGHVNWYTLRADPVSPETGTNHYFTDATRVIRVDEGKPADRSSPPIQVEYPDRSVLAPDSAPPSGQPTTPQTDSQTDSSGSQPQAPSPTPVVPVTKFSPIVSGNVVVPPQRIQYFKFVVPQVAQNAKVKGSFHAFGGAGNDIEAAIMTPFEFENWSNGHEAHVYYNSGKITNGQIEVDGLPPGLYILAFSNRFALVSRKEVTVQVSLSYTVFETQ